MRKAAPGPLQICKASGLVFMGFSVVWTTGPVVLVPPPELVSFCSVQFCTDMYVPRAHIWDSVLSNCDVLVFVLACYNLSYHCPIEACLFSNEKGSSSSRWEGRGGEEELGRGEEKEITTRLN